MLDVMLSYLTGLFQGLMSLLPQSPFSDWATITQDMRTGLGWLNWFFPVDACLGILAAWLLLGVAVTIARYAVKHITQFAGWKAL